MLGTLRREPVAPVREKHHQILQRLQVKQEAIADLIGGRLDLLQATARFRAAQRAEETADTDGEHWCRTVIGWVFLALADYPERAEALCGILQNRLDEHLMRHGCVQLPDA